VLGAASQYSSGFEIANFAPDGLLGMAFEDISEFQANPLIQTLVAEGAISDPIFAFKLASSGSELRIGGVNSALYTGSFTYAPVTEQVRSSEALCIVTLTCYWSGVLANQRRCRQCEWHGHYQGLPCGRRYRHYTDPRGCHNCRSVLRRSQRDGHR
jgi:hypothetical protein